MIKKNGKKLALNRETLTNLSPASLQGVAGGFLSISCNSCNSCNIRCGEKRTVDPDSCKSVDVPCDPGPVIIVA